MDESFPRGRLPKEAREKGSVSASARPTTLFGAKRAREDEAAASAPREKKRPSSKSGKGKEAVGAGAADTMAAGSVTAKHAEELSVKVRA